VFEDRRDAGKKLAQALTEYRGSDILVLAIPRGGVRVGYEVAAALDGDLSVVVARKLPFPDQPEAGFGAIAEDGSAYLHPRVAQAMPKHVIDEVLRVQRREVARRVAALRNGKPLPRIAGRTVILVDDGIAMGSTMNAALQLCINANAARRIVAVPVAGERVARQIEARVDRLVVLETPRPFRAVAQVYRHWHDVSDGEVLEILSLPEQRLSEAPDGALGSSDWGRTGETSGRRTI
jgi:predicted phosphoribosyltransferase